MDYLSTGEMARLNNISAQTLRLCETIGLIFPDDIKSDNGYRYYSIRQSACLDIIQYMKSLGMHNHLTQSYFHNAGTVLRQGYLEKREYPFSEKFLYLLIKNFWKQAR